MSRNAKLDLQALRASIGAVRKRVQQWPAWKQEAVRAVSAVASSSQTRQVLSAAQSSGSTPVCADHKCRCDLPLIRNVATKAVGDMVLTAEQWEVLCDLISNEGCSCECDHSQDEHDDDCQRCFACNVWNTITSQR